MCGAVAALFACACGLLLGLLLSLDAPWLKAQVRAAVLAKTGLEIDYGTLRLGALELTLTDVVVQSPSVVRSAAPVLLQVGRLRVRGALRTEGPPLREVTLENLGLTVVLDEHGKTSFDALGSASATKSPPTPLSRLVPELLGLDLPVERVQVSNIALTLIRSERGAAIMRDVLHGLGLQVDTQPRSQERSLEIALGTRAAPLHLKLEEKSAEGEHTAHARFWLLVQARGAARSAKPESAPAQVSIKLGVDGLEQDLAPAVSGAQGAELEFQAAFDPRAGQSELALTRLSVGDDIARARATLALPDAGSARVQDAAVDVDAARLLDALPAWLVPLRVRSGQVHGKLADLILAPPFAARSAALSAELSGLELSAGGTTLSVSDTAFSLQAEPQRPVLAAQTSLKLRGVRGQNAAVGELRAEALSLVLSGHGTAEGSVTGEATLELGALDVRGESPLQVGRSKLSLRLRDFRAEPQLPLAASGDVVLELAADALEQRSTGVLAAAGLHVRAHAPLTGGAPLSLQTELSCARLQVIAPDGRSRLDRPVRGALALSELVPDLVRPERSQGTAHAELQIGPLAAALDATRHDDTLAFDLDTSASTLTDLVAWLPDDLKAHVALAELGVSLHTRGQLSGFTGPRPQLRQHLQLQLSNLVAKAMSTRALTLELQSAGGATQHTLKADLRVAALRMSGIALGDNQLALDLTFDTLKPRLALDVHNRGLVAADVTAHVGFERKSRALSYTVQSELSEAAKLAPLLARIPQLAALDVSELAARFSAQATLVGVVSEIDRRGSIRLNPNLRQSAMGRTQLALELKKLRWAQGDQALFAPAVRWQAALEREGARHSLESELWAEQLGLGLGPHKVGVEGLHDKSSVVWVAGAHAGTLDHAQALSIRAVQQNAVPGYVLGDLTADIQLHHSPEGLLEISKLQVDNRAAGTRLTVQGGIDFGDDQPRLSMRSKLSQELARLSHKKDLFTGSGTLGLELALRSPDLRDFHALAKLEMAGANLELPGTGVRLENVDGELPIVADFIMDEAGFQLVDQVKLNPYALQRFADQHPLLSHRSFVSVGRLTTPVASVAPFVANLRVEQNVISLAQVEMGVRGGTITGDGLLFWDGERSRAELNIHANDVQSSHGEPFDGNAALRLNLADRSLEGHADILQIGRRHLLDLLDLQDPRRTDPGLNGIRSALRFGYPERVRLAFKHGFASAGVTLGGLARLIKIRDIHGIPLGPLMERVSASLALESSP